jgi:hypothetical protein
VRSEGGGKGGYFLVRPNRFDIFLL